MNNYDLTLFQTLHGYNDGHTLLASSVELPAEARRIMLNLSDMSGGNIERGFEEYITGYPLKDANLFAIAKTWYAPEMSRPGCVWTHTILVSFSDLPKVTNNKLLLSLFKRPKAGLFVDYESDLNVTEEISTYDEFELPKSAIDIQLVTQIISHLYSTSNQALFVVSPNSQSYDEFFLSLWRQQWPRLKRNFSFCTGAVAPRLLNGVALDLQVVPYNFDMRNSYLEIAGIVLGEQTANVEIEDWVERAVEDILYPSADLKRFLNYFGSDVDIRRTSFKTLLKTFTYFSNNMPLLPQSIIFLAENYPSIKDGLNLKSAMLGNEKNAFSKILPKYSEASVLFYLSTTEKYRSFNYAKLNFNYRFLQYFDTFNQESIEILKEIIKKSPNQFGEDAITHLAEAVRGSEMHTVWQDRQLATVFVGLNPKLTFNKDFWLANVNNHQEIISQLSRAGIDEDGWKSICSILIEIDSKIDPETIASHISDFVNIVLDKINQNSGGRVGDNWLSYISNRPESILDWMNDCTSITKHTIAILVVILNPNAPVVFLNGLAPWLRFLKSLAPAEIINLSIDIQVFYLSLAFNHDSQESVDIFERIFESVYFALAMDGVNYNLWHKLEVHTKPLSWLKDWDKCKKIINALVDHFIRTEFPPKNFISHLHSEDLKDKVLKQYKKRK